LQALARPELDHLPLKLIVAGEFYDEEAPYRDLIKDLGIEEKVIMDNTFIPNAEVVRYFCAGDLVVQPYRDATQSGVTQVAYHFDKPMVVSNVGALPEMVPDGKAGYVVNPDPEEIAGAIRKYFDDQMEATFRKGVQSEKKKYSWERFLEAIDKLAEQITI
ncbi:MAG TPA: glycosyltransferase, partial [Bacteroidales bacterium]|nr:glycosyltransferase [Bacteroidales bacterium]